MVFLLVTFSIFFILCTLASLCKFTVWWVRLFDFPRLQFALALALTLCVQLALLDLSQWTTWLLMVSTGACLLFQLWWILPYTPLVRVKVKPASRQDPQYRLALMAANVLTPNRNSPALLKLVHQHQPDILVALETDAWWQSQLDELETDYPFTLKCPQDNLYGMHVYSKLPLHDGQIDFLVEDDKPSMHACVELPCGRRVRAHFLHPAPPSPTENEESLERDAELLVVGKSVADETRPVIVSGDLNDVAWSPTTRRFKKISGLLDPRIGRGLFNTFHAKHWFLRWPLDHVFHSGHFTVGDLKRLPGYGSDHFALFVELYLEDANQDNGLEADGDDYREAKEKTEEAGVRQGDVPSPGS